MQLTYRIYGTQKYINPVAGVSSSSWSSVNRSKLASRTLEYNINLLLLISGPVSGALVISAGVPMPRNPLQRFVRQLLKVVHP